MATQTTVVTETTPGKSWLVFWEVRGTPDVVDGESTTFTCGETDYDLLLTLSENHLGWTLSLDIETTKDDKKSDSMVTVFHEGVREEGLLRNELYLWWPLDTLEIEEEYPDNSYNFQIIIESPGEYYETKGLKFINKNMSKLLETESFADIKFVFKDDHIAAHSAIIAASSPVFAAMFEGGRFKEGQTRTVNIEDIDSQVFRKLLQFLYTGSSGSSRHDPSDALQVLFLAADKYQVDALKEICEECLIHQLELENVLRHLLWAHLYGAEKLKEAAVTYAVQERQQVWKLKEWEELGKNYTDLFYKIWNQMIKNDSASSDDESSLMIYAPYDSV